MADVTKTGRGGLMIIFASFIIMTTVIGGIFVSFMEHVVAHRNC